MIEIVQCTLDDIEQLRDISIKTFTETFEDSNSQENLQQFLDEVYALPVLEKELQHPDTIVYLVKNEQELLGYLKLNKGEAQTETGFDNSLEIQRIYIAKKAKGLGIGSKLMDIATEQAKEWGCSWIWLGVWEHNEPAKCFYRKKGFEEFSSHVFVVGDDPQTDLLMKKNL